MFALSPIVTTALNTLCYFPLIFEYNTIFPRSWVTVSFFRVLLMMEQLVNIIVGVIVIENSFSLDVKKKNEESKEKNAHNKENN